MAAKRQDAWREDEDLLLAETVLRHIREGSTQLRAFEEVAEKLGRTAAACGFRWNSVVRKHYESDVMLAKLTGKKARRRERSAVSAEVPVFYSTEGEAEDGREGWIEADGGAPDGAAAEAEDAIRAAAGGSGRPVGRRRAGALGFAEVIAFLRETAKRVEALEREAAALREQLREREATIERLLKEREAGLRWPAGEAILPDDYGLIVRILERARRLVEEEAGALEPPATPEMTPERAAEGF
ncbi:MAG: RsfA family transcriptional regulator [Hydrogenibacillus schlegelii]|nr:RsfA family transcriptional regulator [Hydrogenibacillus schlegelii]